MPMRSAICAIPGCTETGEGHLPMQNVEKMLSRS